MLWCDYLIQHGILDAATFGPRNAAMLAAYQADQVSAKDFCAFYVGTLDGRSLAEWEPTARAFMAEPIAPR